MSKTVAEIRARVIENLQDFDRSKPAFTTPQIDLAIKGAYQLLASQMPWPHVYTVGGLTIAAGSDTFVMATNLGSDVRIRLQSNGMMLTKTTVEMIDSFRSGMVNAGLAAGVPYSFALWREPGSVGTDLHGRVSPPARSAEVCDIFTDKIPDELVGPALDAQNVLFDTTAAEALILKVSMSLLNRMPAKEAEKLGIEKSVANEWAGDLGLLLYSAAKTHFDIESAGFQQRWVS